MEIKTPHFQERRQFKRIKIPTPTLCKLCFPKNGELREYSGIIKEISLGNIYLVCDEQAPFEINESRHLILDVVSFNQKIYRLEFQALVARIDKEGAQVGIALRLLSDPIYHPLKESYNKDYIRLLYQHYQLFKKNRNVINSILKT